METDVLRTVIKGIYYSRGVNGQRMVLRCGLLLFSHSLHRGHRVRVLSA